MCIITWESPRSEFEQASIDSIVQRFDEAQPVSEHNRRVRRLSETVIIKRLHVAFDSRRECDNQMLAWKLLNGELLRVPAPIRYIEHLYETDGVYGYLVMEYLYGTPLEEVDVQESVDAIAGAILQIHTRSCRLAQPLPPGPSDGGLADGFPWGLNGAEIEFNTVQDLQECVNKRLRTYAKSRRRQAPDCDLNLQKSKFGLCHLDLVPRNILILKDGGIGIVDWSTLAYYPVVFELASLWWLRNGHIAWINHTALFDLLMTTLHGATGVSAEDAIKLEIVQSQSLQCY